MSVNQGKKEIEKKEKSRNLSKISNDLLFFFVKKQCLFLSSFFPSRFLDSTLSSSLSTSSSSTAQTNLETGGTTSECYVPYPKSDSPFFRCEPDACVKIRVAKKGVASLPPTTVVASLKKAVELKGSLIALRQQDKDGNWKQWTWKEVNANDL